MPRAFASLIRMTGLPMATAPIGRRGFMGRAAALGSLLAAVRQTSAAPSASGEPQPVVFPYPQFIKFGDRGISFKRAGRAGICVVASEQAGPAAFKAAGLIASEIQRRTGKEIKITAEPAPRSYPIRLSTFVNSQGQETQTEGGYRLNITPEGVSIEGNGIGLSYAAASLCQLIEGSKELSFPEVEIRDWPEFSWRGIYNEVVSVAGMSLDDWREFIRFAASLKLNAINVGLYNCWERPSSVELDAEFFLFRSRHYPQFRTPIRSVHFSAQEGRAVIRKTLPAIYAEDFFGEVVRYGKEHGIEVSPCFTSLSHNTLIPRLVPEVSMKDADCHPIGYGFCTTCPKTYEILFTLYDEIISRYMRPHGITTFNVGMDEVRYSCKCPSCREAWNGVHDFYVDHLIKISTFLKRRGMKRILMWHDMLHRTGLLNQQFVDRLKSEGLLDVITIGWWNYDEPLYADSLDARNSFGKAFFRPKTPIKAWATPSAGWDTLRPLGASLRTQSTALWSLMALAKQRGAEGAISYSIHDPVFREGYVNFAQYSWNQKPTLEETERRYSVWLCGKDAADWSDAMRQYAAVYNAYSQFIVTFYNRVKVVPAGAALAAIPSQVCRESLFETAVSKLGVAAEQIEALQKKNPDVERARLLARYGIEVRRLRTFLAAGYRVLKCNAEYDNLRARTSPGSLNRLSIAFQVLNQAVEEYGACIEEQERICYPASQPRFLVYEAHAYSDFRKLAKLFGTMLARVREGETEYLPEISVADERLFGSDVGMVLPEREH